MIRGRLQYAAFFFLPIACCEGTHTMPRPFGVFSRREWAFTMDKGQWPDSGGHFAALAGNAAIIFSPSDAPMAVNCIYLSAMLIFWHT